MQLSSDASYLSFTTAFNSPANSSYSLVSEGSSLKERSRSVRSAVFYSAVPSPDHSDSDTLRSNSPKTSRAPSDRCQSGSRLRHAVASSPCTSSAATSADLRELITDDDRSRTSVSSSSSSGRAAAAAVCVVSSARVAPAADTTVQMQHNNNNALPPSTANTVVTQVSNGRSAHSAAANSEYKTEKVQRKWQVLPGRNRYWCDGRIIMSRQSGVFYFTVILICGTMGLFFGFDAPYLWRHVSPAIPIVAACLLALVLAQLLRTSFSDPGVMPRADVAEATHTENQINLEQQQPAGTALANMYRPPPRTREVVINGQPVKLKYCFTCRVFRPPRTSHCSVCDNCILNFDHHCPWVGNCVGLRNYRHFYLFILLLSFLCIYVFICSVVHLVLHSQKTDFLDAMRKSPGSLVVILISFFAVWSVLGLSGFHSYLIGTSQTTNEDIKGTFNRKRQPSIANPYSAGGVCANLCATLCAPEPPSLIDRRGFVLPEREVRVPASMILQTACAPVPASAAAKCVPLHHHPQSGGQGSAASSSSGSTQMSLSQQESQYGSL